MKALRRASQMKPCQYPCLVHYRIPVTVAHTKGCESSPRQSHPCLPLGTPCPGSPPETEIHALAAHTAPALGQLRDQRQVSSPHSEGWCVCSSGQAPARLGVQTSSVLWVLRTWKGEESNKRGAILYRGQLTSLTFYFYNVSITNRSFYFYSFHGFCWCFCCLFTKSCSTLL